MYSIPIRPEIPLRSLCVCAVVVAVIFSARMNGKGEGYRMSDQDLVEQVVRLISDLPLTVVTLQ